MAGMKIDLTREDAVNDDCNFSENHAIKVYPQLLADYMDIYSFNYWKQMTKWVQQNNDKIDAEN